MLDVEAEGLVAESSGLYGAGGVIGDDEEGFLDRLEVLSELSGAWDSAIAADEDTVCVKEESVVAVDEVEDMCGGGEVHGVAWCSGVRGVRGRERRVEREGGGEEYEMSRV